jgi:hypothetical protein
VEEEEEDEEIEVEEVHLVEIEEILDLLEEMILEDEKEEVLVIEEEMTLSTKEVQIDLKEILTEELILQVILKKKKDLEDEIQEVNFLIEDQEEIQDEIEDLLEDKKIKPKRKFRFFIFLRSKFCFNLRFLSRNIFKQIFI